MLKLSCADMGASCQWEATAETGAELKNKVWAHAKAAHKDMMAEMSEAAKAEMDAQIDALIEIQGG